MELPPSWTSPPAVGRVAPRRWSRVDEGAGDRGREIVGCRPAVTTPEGFARGLPFLASLDMTDGTFPGAGAEGLQPSGETPQDDEVRWPLALGLGALAGLWPAAGLEGLRELVDPSPTALLVLTVITVTWISWVGFLEVRQPILTLALAGTVAGVVVIALGPVLGPDAALDGASTSFIEIVRGTAVGVLSGLLARTLQQARR